MKEHGKTSIVGRPGNSIRCRCSGFTLAELLVVLFLLACMAGAAWHISHQVLMRKQCKRNLYTIYNALELYEIDRGTLPRLAFFPDKPRTDPDSPLVVLRPYCSDPSVFVCPSAPDHYRQTGLTYIWNVNLNGRKMRGVEPPAWIMTELQALEDTVPAPHLGIYNVLYTDGHVRKMKAPPEGVR